MIKATKWEWSKRLFYWVEYRLVLRRRFRKLMVKGQTSYPGQSILLLQNHFSWWDGFIGSYISYKHLKKSYHVMVQENQLERHRYFRYKGAFSVKKQSRELFESLSYAQALLRESGNLVLVFPQGRLQSMHATKIHIERGVHKLIEGCDNTCRILYNAVVLDYFEGFKPIVTCHLLDLGTADHIDINTLEEKITDFHRKVLKESVRE